MNRMEIKLTLFSLMVLCLCYSTGLSSCDMDDFEDNYKQLNISNPLDRKILIGISDAKDCLVNMTKLQRIILTTKLKTLKTRKNRVMVSLKFSCEFEITVHFPDFNNTDNSKNVSLDLELIFSNCSIILNDVNTFLKIGTILMLRNIKNSIEMNWETNCLYAYNLQGIHLEVSCEKKYKLNHSFWESCTQIFPNMTLFSVIGCEYNNIEINSSALQEKFPNLDSLVLKFVTVEKSIFFPWKKSTIIHNENVDNILKVLFDSYKHIFFYNMFPGNSILLIHCKVNTRRLVFEETVDMIVLTGMGLSYLEPSLLHKVSVRQTLDLSKNKLEIIYWDLLKNQHELLHLYLQENELTFISSSMFSGLEQLRYINLANNKIKFIVGDPFKSLYHLKDIILQNNSIAQIPSDMFRDQSHSLEYLAINSNPYLTDIPVWPIQSTKFYHMDVGNSSITGDSIIRLLDDLNILDDTEKLVDRAIDPSYLPLGDIASVDLSFNKIETIPSENMNTYRMIKLKFLFRNYMIGFDGNPFTCNCDTSVIQEIVSDADDLVYMKYDLAGWLCVNPHEFGGRHMWAINDTEKYCPISDVHCPSQCSCFKRISQETVIVDCRDTVLKNMPKRLPNFQLELWFQNSNISEIDPLPYLENVTVLNLAHNKVGHIEPMTLNRLKLLKVLHLHSNHLKSIPLQVRSLTLSRLTLSDNPFICDCTTIWIKRWVLDDEKLVLDWTNIKCLDNSNNLQQLIAVPDSKFVCKEDNSFNVAEHVFLPSIIIGSILFVLVALSLMIYFQSFNLKVLLFIHFNLHPFDKQQDRKKYYGCDAVIIYQQCDLELKVKIEDHLVKRGFKIADLYKNSFIGYTYVENIEKLINCSNKAILIISDCSINDKIMQTAWNIAYNRAMSTSMSSLILVSDKVIKQRPNLDISLLQFLKSNHFLDRKANSLKEKVEYLMQKAKPAENPDIDTELHMSNLSVNNNAHESLSILIQSSYPDEHHLYVKNEIIPFLSSNNIQVKSLDMEFTPGADIRDELPTILDRSRHILFFFSEETLADEVRLYILSQALTKTHLENHNYLLLCTSGRIILERMTNDLSRYVENYVTISVNDPKFKDRILASVTHDYRIEWNDQTDFENDPLLHTS